MKIEEILSDAGSVAISGHVRPDGDCAGSALALYGYILKNFPGICVDVFLEKPSESISFLKYFDKINSGFDKDKKYDLFISVDCASKERLGKGAAYFDSAARTVNIDHHISNTSFADENYVFGGLSSCSEALFGFLDTDKMDADIAAALYVGIVTDTGVFKYEATTPETMRVAARLMEFGIPTNDIIDESFFLKTYTENRIMGYALEKSELFCGGRGIISSLSKEEMKMFGARGSDLEGIVSQLRLTKGVMISVFMHETDENTFKVSFRSGSEADVNEIASRFGGGGHLRAAGATLEGDPGDCLVRLKRAVSEALG